MGKIYRDGKTITPAPGPIADMLESKFAEVLNPEGTTRPPLYFTTSNKEHFLSYYSSSKKVYVYNRETNTFEVAYDDATSIGSFFEDDKGNVFCVSRESSKPGVFKFNKETRVFDKLIDGGYYTSTASPFVQTSKGVFTKITGNIRGYRYNEETNTFDLTVPAGFNADSYAETTNGLFVGGMSGSSGIYKWNDNTGLFEITAGSNYATMNQVFVVNDNEVYFSSNQSSSRVVLKWKPEANEFVDILPSDAKRYNIAYHFVDNNNTFYFSGRGISSEIIGLWTCKYGEYTASQLTTDTSSYPYYFETPNYVLASTDSTYYGFYAINKSTLEATKLSSSFTLYNGQASGNNIGYISKNEGIFLKVKQSPYMLILDEATLTLSEVSAMSTLTFYDVDKNPGAYEDKYGNIFARSNLTNSDDRNLAYFDKATMSFKSVGSFNDSIIFKGELYTCTGSGTSASQQCQRFNNETKTSEVIPFKDINYQGVMGKLEIRDERLYALGENYSYEFVLDEDIDMFVRTDKFKSSFVFGDVRLTGGSGNFQQLISDGSENIASLKYISSVALDRKQLLLISSRYILLAL